MLDSFPSHFGGTNSGASLGAFEPTVIRSSQWKVDELRNVSSVLHWLGQGYPVRQVQVLHDWGVHSEHWEIEIGRGEYRVGVNHLNPFTLKCMDLPVTFHVGHIVRTSKYPYTNGLRELVRLIRHLEKMPDCPVMVAFYKVGKLPDVILKDCPVPQPSGKRLRKVYRRILGDTPMGICDQQGEPYIKIDFKPQHPIPNMLSWEEALSITGELTQN